MAHMGVFQCPLFPKNLSPWIFLSGFQHICCLSQVLFFCSRWQWVIHLPFSGFEKCPLHSHLSVLRKFQIIQNKENSFGSVLQAAPSDRSKQTNNSLRKKSSLLFLDPGTSVPHGEHRLPPSEPSPC